MYVYVGDHFILFASFFLLALLESLQSIFILNWNMSVMLLGSVPLGLTEYKQVIKQTNQDTFNPGLENSNTPAHDKNM